VEPRNFGDIRQLAGDLFPGAADYSRGEYRAGRRPMTPAGPPILGAGRHSEPVLQYRPPPRGMDDGVRFEPDRADLMLGRAPEIDLQGLGRGREFWIGLSISYLSP